MLKETRNLKSSAYVYIYMTGSRDSQSLFLPAPAIELDHSLPKLQSPTPGL